MEYFTNGFIKRISVASFALLFAVACAETPQEAQIKKLVEQNMGEGMKVDVVTKTPYAGLYEVQTGGNIFYTDAKGEFVFAGHIFEAKTRRDITKERLIDINKLNLLELPLDQLAIKKVKGDGSRVIAVFSDPNCGYCKRLEENLKGVDNVTVYTFMYNILSADSVRKSKNIWCAPDRSKAWEDWMLKGKEATPPKGDCEDPGAKVYEMGKKLNIDGTPTIYFSDGTRISGAMDAKGFEEKFATIKSK